MNERIKDLAEQAAEYAAENAAGDWEVGPDYQDVFNKKFAELIVKECMSCATWVGKVNKNPVEPIHTAHAVNLRIKKHFGVEE